MDFRKRTVYLLLTDMNYYMYTFLLSWIECLIFTCTMFDKPPGLTIRLVKDTDVREHKVNELYRCGND